MDSITDPDHSNTAGAGEPVSARPDQTTVGAGETIGAQPDELTLGSGDFVGADPDLTTVAEGEPVAAEPGQPTTIGPDIPKAGAESTNGTPSHVGRYCVRSVLGEGGFGTCVPGLRRATGARRRGQGAAPQACPRPGGGRVVPR